MHKPISWWTVALVCVVIAAGMLSYRGWMLEQIDELHERETAYTVSLARLNADSNDLRMDIEHAGTESDIEEKARIEHGYMKEGELRFAFDNAEALDDYTAREQLIYEKETGYLPY